MHHSHHTLLRLQTTPSQRLEGLYESLRQDESFVTRLDRVGVLGISEEGAAVSQIAHYGHTGCVNALGWNETGELLVSGSDDFRLCIWRMGHADGTGNPAKATGLRRHWPQVGLGLQSVIHTGHRRNIFSAKFAPYTNSNRIISCAGDSQVRVFEIERATSSTYIRGTKGRTWTEYGEGDGACIRVFRCHTDRAKRIALEGSPDVFLTCGEDGTVRQHDLRQAHDCTPSMRGKTCPQPLADYTEYRMGLYSLTISQARPDVFVVAGTSPYAFLHDRRMSRRSMLEKWGQILKPNLPTQCVRRFGLPAEPAPHDEAGRNSLRSRLFHDKHVTATKLSHVNGRDLLVSYSGEAIYRYDILADPGPDEVVAPTTTTTEEPSAAVLVKRKRSAVHDSSEQLAKRTSPPSVPLARVRKRSRSPVLAAKVDSAPDVSSMPASESSEAGPSYHVDESTDGRSISPDDEMSVDASEQSANSALRATRSRRGQVVRLLGLHQDDVSREHPEHDAMQSADHLRPARDAVELALQMLDALRDVPDDESLVACRRYAAGLLQDPLPVDIDSMKAEAQDAVRLAGWDRSISGRRGAGDRLNYEVSLSEDGAIEVAFGRIFGDSESDRDARAPIDSSSIGAAAVIEGADEGHYDADDADDDDDHGDGDEGNGEGLDSGDEAVLQRTRELRDREAGVQGGVPVVLPLAKYDGHRNVDTVKDVNFGFNDEHVVSGSDDGRMFIWNKQTTALEGIWTGDGSVVNVISFHPHLPVCAVSGIDDTVKIFAPTSSAEKRFACLHDAKAIMERNKDGRNRGRGLMAPSAQMFIQLLADRMMEEGSEDADAPRRTIRIDSNSECIVS